MAPQGGESAQKPFPAHPESVPAPRRAVDHQLMRPAFHLGVAVVAAVDNFERKFELLTPCRRPRSRRRNAPDATSLACAVGHGGSAHAEPARSSSWCSIAGCRRARIRSCIRPIRTLLYGSPCLRLSRGDGAEHPSVAQKASGLPEVFVRVQLHRVWPIPPSGGAKDARPPLQALLEEDPAICCSTSSTGPPTNL